MEDMFRCRFLEPRVPDETNAVRVVSILRIFVVTRDQQFRENS